MVKDAAGVWEVTTDPLTEGFHGYSLLIDGVVVADPASETFLWYGMDDKRFRSPMNVICYYVSPNASYFNNGFIVTA